MVKLTAELIVSAYQRINPVMDRELDLRGYKIPMIENLGATLNQFDTIDFSENDVRKLDNFPLLPRLKHLLFNNNRIVRISPTLNESIENLETLVLTNNMLSELGDVDSLVPLKKLTCLSLLFNPVSTKEHYRLYVIFRLPQLRILDFRKIKKKERDEATSFFKTAKGKELRKAVAAQRKTKLEEDDENMDVEESGAPAKANGFRARAQHGASEEDAAAIKEAIRSATSLEEIERLNQMLKSGQIPSSIKPMEEETDENPGEQEGLDTTA